MSTRPVAGREEQRIARRYMHRTRFRPCGVGRFCALCWWRKVSGANRRALAEHKRRMAEVTADLAPIRYRRDADGRMRRLDPH